MMPFGHLRTDTSHGSLRLCDILLQIFQVFGQAQRMKRFVHLGTRSGDKDQDGKQQHRGKYFKDLFEHRFYPIHWG
jgi:hypothetical protein